jgi:hypothetical protein
MMKIVLKLMDKVNMHLDFGLDGLLHYQNILLNDHLFIQ